MNETKKLADLRQKLVTKRRALVDGFQNASPNQLTGDAISQIQGAIEAVDRAIEDEKHTGSAGATPRERPSVAASRTA